MRTYRLETPAFVIRVVCNDSDDIVEVAPIMKWSLGKKYDLLLNWCKKKWPGKTHSLVMSIQ